MSRVLGTIVSLLIPTTKAAEEAASSEPADLLSDLPDDVLCRIVSLLPPKAGGRTAVLSRRWRHIWQSAPLDLDIHARNTDLLCVTASYISRLLSCRRGPLRSFSASLCGGQPREEYDAWVQALARRSPPHIHDALVLKFPVCCWGVQTYFPSVPLYRLAHSLRRLELHVCSLDIAAAGEHEPMLLLPRLRSLHLNSVKVSDEAALQRMLDGCTALQDLTLLHVHGLRRLALRSRTLATLCIMPLDELSFDDVPSLESIDLVHTNLWSKPAIARAAAAHPNLGQVTLRMPLLHRYTAASIRRARPLSVVTVLHLSMEFAQGDADELIKAACVLTLFPSLHTLQIWCLNLRFERGDVGLGQWQPEAQTINCKKVQMQGYSGTKGEVEFARFLLDKAKLLQSMEVFHLLNWSNKDIDLHRNRICPSGKASSGAQLYFSRSKKRFDQHAMATYMHKVCLV